MDVKLLYNPGDRKFNQLMIRYGRENQHPERLGPEAPDRAVGVQVTWRDDAGMRNMSQRGWAPRPPVEQPRRTGKKRGYGQ